MFSLFARSVSPEQWSGPERGGCARNPHMFLVPKTHAAAAPGLRLRAPHQSAPTQDRHPIAANILYARGTQPEGPGEHHNGQLLRSLSDCTHGGMPRCTC